MDRNQLPIHALLAAAFINFLACTSEFKRAKTLSEWLAQINEQNTTEIDKTTNLTAFSLKNFLTDEQELMQWRSEGLSSDVLVVENALAVLQVGLQFFCD